MIVVYYIVSRASLPRRLKSPGNEAVIHSGLDGNPYHHVTQDGTVPERDVKLGVEVLPLDSWAK